jgi:hypothetical protein
VSKKSNKKINLGQINERKNNSPEFSKNGSSVPTKSDVIQKKQKRKKLRFFIALILWIVALIAALYFISSRYI